MYARERARHEHAFLALREVLSGCAAAGIDVLPVKGVLTARLFYRDPGERPIRDIDLRVKERDLARVEHAGRRNGWRLLSRSWAYRTLAFEVLGFLVEFESHVGPPGLCGLPVEDMLRRARPSVEPLGLPHLQPEIHDHAVLLCVNAFKDKLVDAVPGAIRDLELLPIQPGFVPDRFVSLAATSDVVTIAWIVANWLVEARPSTGWHGLRDRLGRMSPRARYARLFDRVVRSRIPFRQTLRILARAGSDRPSRQIAALCVMAAEPVAATLGRGLRANVWRVGRTEGDTVQVGRPASAASVPYSR
jgi:hypothetical protein